MTTARSGGPGETVVDVLGLTEPGVRERNLVFAIHSRVAERGLELR